MLDVSSGPVDYGPLDSEEGAVSLHSFPRLGPKSGLGVAHMFDLQDITDEMLEDDFEDEERHETEVGLVWCAAY